MKSSYFTQTYLTNVQRTADTLYESCLKMFDERVTKPEHKAVLIEQLEMYYHADQSDKKQYLKDLQFMYEYWSKSLPKKQEPPQERKVIKFFNPMPDLSKSPK